VAGNGAADYFDSVVAFLGRELFFEPLSGADSDSAESVCARSDFGIGRDKRGDGCGFLPAQAAGDGASELSSASIFTHDPLLRYRSPFVG